ncbi:hypothetical protein DFP73DRAFT_173879 [Morchella snyderi]|nr:hypothetical protein DFP73DRAFT_173879 [Morchella snyderi]
MYILVSVLCWVGTVRCVEQMRGLNCVELSSVIGLLAGRACRIEGMVCHSVWGGRVNWSWMDITIILYGGRGCLPLYGSISATAMPRPGPWIP